MPDASKIEDHLHVPLAARGAGGGYRLAVLLEPEAGPDHGLEADLRRYPHGELEAARLPAVVLLGTVGVGAGEAHLLVPERREVENAPRPRHPDEGDLARGPREA